jgi:hypothetical protein
MLLLLTVGNGVVVLFVMASIAVPVEWFKIQYGESRRIHMKHDNLHQPLTYILGSK